MAGNLADVMAAIGDGLRTIDGLRVFDFPPNSAQPPFAFVGMPESIAYDLTMRRGSDRFTIDVYVGVSSVVDRSAQAALCDYAAGSGPLSIKEAIESFVGPSVRVTEATFSSITLAAGTYAGLVVTVDQGI